MTSFTFNLTDKLSMARFDINSQAFNDNTEQETVNLSQLDIKKI